MPAREPATVLYFIVYIVMKIHHRELNIFNWEGNHNNFMVFVRIEKKKINK